MELGPRKNKNSKALVLGSPETGDLGTIDEEDLLEVVIRDAGSVNHGSVEVAEQQPRRGR